MDNSAAAGAAPNLPSARTMVERVAKALAEKRRARDQRRLELDEVDVMLVMDYYLPDALEDARAAIEAMQEPTHAIVAAGERIVDDQFDHWDPGQFHGIREAWQAMISAALAEGTAAKPDTVVE